MARSPSPDPRQADLFEGRNPLTARRESAPAGLMVGPKFTKAASGLTPRQRAQHFAAKASARRVRPARSAAASQMRRVIVKARVVRMGPTARKALLTHVRYVERDGAGPEGETEKFFSRSSDQADGRAFVERCTDDRHHFRLIVNPEDGRELPDLKAYARSFMAQVERDLGTMIDWIGGAHYDTGRPHLHLLLRGKRDDGRDLVLPREYVSHGLRSRAQELATELLGPRLERAAARDREVQAEGFTALDRRLLQATQDGRIGMPALQGEGSDLLLRRLTHLETRGLVSRDHAGAWQIPDGLRTTLQDLGEAQARERAALKAFWGSQLGGEAHRLQALAVGPGARVVGAYVGFAPLNQALGAQALVLDLLDGRLAHLRMPNVSSLLALDRIPEGAVVEVQAVAVTGRTSDQTIAEIAAERGGVYSFEDHRAARPHDREAFIERHVRRLESMSREGACEALGQGRFKIGPGYEDAARMADEARAGGAILQVHVVDHRPLSEQVRARGYTFLDRTLRTADSTGVGAGGFGGQVRRAAMERGEHLRGLGLASGHPLTLTSQATKVLLAQEIEDVFVRLGHGGKPVFMAKEGQRFSGLYIDRAHISGRAYAVIEGRNAITLAPWREALEACRSQSLSGVLRDGTVDFRFGQMAGTDLGRGFALGR